MSAGPVPSLTENGCEDVYVWWFPGHLLLVGSTGAGLLQQRLGEYEKCLTSRGAYTDGIHPSFVDLAKKKIKPKLWKTEEGAVRGTEDMWTGELRRWAQRVGARERVLGGLVAAASTKSKCVESAVRMYDASATGRCVFCGEWCQRVKRRKIAGPACSGHPLANEAEADKACIARLEVEIKNLRVQLEASQQALTAAQKSTSEERLREARNREDAMAALDLLAQEHHRHLQAFISEHLAKKEVSPRYELPAGVSVEARKVKGKPSAGRFIVWGHGMRITVPFDACASEPCQLPCDRPGAKTCGLDLCAHRLALRARMDADTLKSKQWIKKYKDPKASS